MAFFMALFADEDDPGAIFQVVGVHCAACDPMRLPFCNALLRRVALYGAQGFHPFSYVRWPLSSHFHDQRPVENSPWLRWVCGV